MMRLWGGSKRALLKFNKKIYGKRFIFNRAGTNSPKTDRAKTKYGQISASIKCGLPLKGKLFDALPVNSPSYIEKLYFSLFKLLDLMLARDRELPVEDKKSFFKLLTDARPLDRKIYGEFYTTEEEINKACKEDLEERVNNIRSGTGILSTFRDSWSKAPISGPEINIATTKCDSGIPPYEVEIKSNSQAGSPYRDNLTGQIMAAKFGEDGQVRVYNHNSGNSGWRPVNEEDAKLLVIELDVTDEQLLNSYARLT